MENQSIQQLEFIISTKRKTRKALRPEFADTKYDIEETNQLYNINDIYKENMESFKIDNKNINNLNNNISNSNNINTNINIEEKDYTKSMNNLHHNINNILSNQEELYNKNEESPCPFLVGSSSEASYERSCTIYPTISHIEFNSDNEIDISLSSLISSLPTSISNLQNSGGINELQNWLSKVIDHCERFGLVIQNRLEVIENEKKIKYNTFQNQNLTKYNELILRKEYLLSELQYIENEIKFEEKLLKDQKNEFNIQEEKLNEEANNLKNELTDLTKLICWLEEIFQLHFIPILRFQHELLLENTREEKILLRLRNEIIKIENEENNLKEKLEEIKKQSINKKDNIELLEEQVKLAQISKSEKLQKVNFKEASLITQTIISLNNQILQAEEEFRRILHNEKELDEQLERIKKFLNDETSRYEDTYNNFVISKDNRKKDMIKNLQELSKQLKDSNINLSYSTSEFIKDISETVINRMNSAILIEEAHQEDE
ncbi:hypothetical protein ACR3K2_38780 [Cryptosporidium serpentis]